MLQFAICFALQAKSGQSQGKEKRGEPANVSKKTLPPHFGVRVPFETTAFVEMPSVLEHFSRRMRKCVS